MWIGQGEKQRHVDIWSLQQVEQHRDALKRKALQMWRRNSTPCAVATAMCLWGMLGLKREDYPWAKKVLGNPMMTGWPGCYLETDMPAQYGRVHYCGYSAGMHLRARQLQELGIDPRVVEKTLARNRAKDAETARIMSQWEAQFIFEQAAAKRTPHKARPAVRPDAP